MNAAACSSRGLSRAAWAIPLLALLFLGFHGVVSAQSTRNSYPAPSQTAPPGANSDPFRDEHTAIDEKLQHSRERAREVDRQKRMVDDANRLLALALQFQTQVQKHGSATPEDERLLADMEKLARSVKDRMRGM